MHTLVFCTLKIYMPVFKGWNIIPCAEFLLWGGITYRWFLTQKTDTCLNCFLCYEAIWGIIRENSKYFPIGNKSHYFFIYAICQMNCLCLVIEPSSASLEAIWLPLFVFTSTLTSRKSCSSWRKLATNKAFLS